MRRKTFYNTVALIIFFLVYTYTESARDIGFFWTNTAFVLAMLGIVYLFFGHSLLYRWFNHREDILEPKRYVKSQGIIDDITHRQYEIEANDFLELRSHRNPKTNRGQLNDRVSRGVYVLTNQETGRSYVGQSKNIYNRVNQHLTGRGNGDVYVDFKNGDMFTICFILLEDTDCLDNKELERKAIALYDAKDNGYNKTKGDKSPVKSSDIDWNQFVR